ncbi:Bulb-type lectin domain [Dillenia turbinata]|uniref:Bulb-type lectin domain n=1 Tax=Dillenia turbinata TaxID=194707 RepID=A0AAN8VSC3_9MAGN
MEYYTLFCITFLFTSFTFFPTNSISLDIITPTQSLKDGDTIASSDERFELGFFSPWNLKSSKYQRKQLFEWQTEITHLMILPESSNSTIMETRDLVIKSFKHSQSSHSDFTDLDSGNFIIREENDSTAENYIWQSFDYPTSTLLPGMKLGWNLKTGLDRVITSWRSSEDPDQGKFSFKVVYNGSPEIYLLRKQEREYRRGPWNGCRFSGVPKCSPSTFQLVLFPIARKYTIHFGS